MAQVLVVDDDPFVREYVKNALERLGHEVVSAESMETASAVHFSQRFDVAIVDVCLPDGDGLEMLSLLRREPGAPEVIVLTGQGDPDTAEGAMRGGAWDFIVKPCSLDRMTHSLRRALEYRSQKRGTAEPKLQCRHIVGNSPQLRECLQQAAVAAANRLDVLITGETGTGKDVLARAIHESSADANRPFVVVDCAALPSSLAESLLFGHVRGAFTGANTSRQGLIRQAHGGTLFLDEVGELPPDVQSTFLRVLQERKYRPVGAHHEESSRFRLIAATNRNLGDMTESGQFRSDLLFRLKALEVCLPPLRERTGDIASLAVHLLARLARDNGEDVKGASPEFLAVLAAYDWPGNIRELRNILKTAMHSAGGCPTLHPHHLPVEFKVRYARGAMGGRVQQAEKEEPYVSFSPQGGDGGTPLPWKAYRRQAMECAERAYVRSLMEYADGDSKRAMALSGLKSARFYQLLREHWREASS